MTTYISEQIISPRRLNDIVFTIFLTSNPGHLVPCIIDNVGTILCNQTSNMILINATLIFRKKWHKVCYGPDIVPVTQPTVSKD